MVFYSYDKFLIVWLLENKTTDVKYYDGWPHKVQGGSQQNERIQGRY